jgi:hypothetical protein
MTERRRPMGNIPASYPGGHGFNSRPETGYTAEVSFGYVIPYRKMSRLSNWGTVTYFRNIPNPLSLTLRYLTFTPSTVTYHVTVCLGSAITSQIVIDDG